MNNVFWYALDRDVDHTGISGTGRIAYAMELPHGRGVWVLWNTGVRTAGWYPDLATVTEIHGHNGATRITRLANLGEPELDLITDLMEGVLPDVISCAVDIVRMLVMS